DFPSAAPLSAGKSLRFQTGRYVLQMVPTCTGGDADSYGVMVDVSADAPDPPLVDPGSGTPVSGDNQGGDSQGGAGHGGSTPGSDPGDAVAGVVGGDHQPGQGGNSEQTHPSATGSASPNTAGQGGGEAVQAGSGQGAGDGITDPFEVRPYTPPAELMA